MTSLYWDGSLNPIRFLSMAEQGLSQRDKTHICNVISHCMKVGEMSWILIAMSEAMLEDDNRLSVYRTPR